MGDWRKSTYSSANGGQCVETASRNGVVLVRDTVDRDGAVLGFSAQGLGGLYSFAAVVGLAFRPAEVGETIEITVGPRHRQPRPSACHAAGFRLTASRYVRLPQIRAGVASGTSRLVW